MMDSILVFSISSDPNYGLDFEQLSSYGTITPYSFRPTFSLNTDRADRALLLKASHHHTLLGSTLMGTAIKRSDDQLRCQPSRGRGGVRRAPSASRALPAHQPRDFAEGGMSRARSARNCPCV